MSEGADHGALAEGSANRDLVVDASWSESGDLPMTH
jgi:hypothetical protein